MGNGFEDSDFLSEVHVAASSEDVEFWPGDEGAKIGETFQGVYKYSKPPRGKMSTPLHVFAARRSPPFADGEAVGVWGSKVIDPGMADVPVGALVTFKFEGERDVGKQSPAKIYTVTFRLPKPGAAAAKVKQDDVPF